MALVDVTELLLDPDFVNTVTLIHRTATVNTRGVNVLVETNSDTIGSVQPANSKELQRLPEALRQRDVRSFYIKTEILIDGTSQYPDLISFGGNRFEVINSEPWLNWGSGWNKGLCVAQKPSL